MTQPDPIVVRQLPVIHKIIQDETWLEGERRGCQVSPHDPAVRERVCDIVLRVGQQLRDSLRQAIAAEVEAKQDESARQARSERAA